MMSSATDSTDMLAISRREALRRTALLLGAAVSSSLVACVDRARPTRSNATPAPVYLSAQQFALAGAIAERILPRTDTPGAADVGVPSFIDLVYGEFMTGEEQRMLIEGLAEVDEASVTARQASFPSLTPAQQDELLREIATVSQNLEKSFFRQIREVTVLGYFTSEEVGRNVLHYDPVPGRFDPCTPISEVGNIVWTT